MNVWKALKSTDENFKTFVSSLSPPFAFSEVVLVFSLFWAGSGVYIRKPIFFCIFGELDTGIPAKHENKGIPKSSRRRENTWSFEPYESNGLNSPAAYRLQCINKLLPILVMKFIALYLPSMVRIRFFGCRLIRLDFIFNFNGKNKKSR